MTDQTSRPDPRPDPRADPRPVAWTKGHGAQNDFLLVEDPDGRAYAWLDGSTVRAMCERRGGIGADGVLRVVRCDAIADGQAYAEKATWFMDFRNADGSVGEMCGNGVRVFAHYLVEAGLADRPAVGEELPIATRAGLRPVRFGSDGLSTVDMGPAVFPDVPTPTITVETSRGRRGWTATAVDMGNPHGVVYVDDLADPGALVEPPTWSPAESFPAGVNVEFVVRRGPGHLAMRIHERGVGETRACGTGACAAAAVTARLDDLDDLDGLGGRGGGVVEGQAWAYRIDVPGGTLRVDRRPDGNLELTGPAVLVGRGTFGRPVGANRGA